MTPLMKHRTRFVAFFASIPLVACSPDFVAPTKSPTTPSFAVAAAPSAGNYMVLMKGNGIPTGFAETVSSLGGTITFAHAPTGFVAVSGLTSVAATKLRATNGVSEVDADQAFSLRDNLMPVSADAAAVGTVVGESQTNPAGAFFYSVAHYQWNMDAISAPAAWAAGKLGSPTVTVAILDTGIDYDSFDERAGSTPGLVDLSRSKSFMDTY